MHLPFGDDNVSGEFYYSNSSSDDGDIIHTRNDSAVLLYRANPMEQWHTIPYELEGDWDWGVFTAPNLQSGQYTIGVIDKQLWSVANTSTQSLNIYHIPTNGSITVETEPADYRITNLMGQILMTGRVEAQRIDVSELPAGTYFIIINGITQKFIVL